MKRNWVFGANPGSGESSSYTLSLGLKDVDSGKVVDLIPSGSSIEDFRKDLASIKDELDQLLKQAEESVLSLQQKGLAGKGPAPEKVWQTMETCASEEEMFEYFNSFDEKHRQEIAEYIFTHVSMFKGRGVVFAGHYDAASHVLS